MGAVFQGRDAPPRARYSFRLRRALPALVLLLALAVLAGMTWLKVLDQVNAGASSAASCGRTADPAKVQLRIYNATAREGLARTVATQLAGRGFLIMATENDPLSGVRPVEGTAEVRYGPAGSRFAQQVRRQVPGATLYRDARAGAVIDLVIGERYKRLSTKAELARARQAIAAAPAGGGPAATGPVPKPAPKPAGKPATRSTAPAPSPTC